MKKMLVLVLVVAGLGFVAKGQTEYLVTVDPAKSTYTIINSIPGVAWILVPPNYTTLDDSDNTYIFVGTPPARYPAYLYTLNNSNGDIISDPLFSTPPDRGGFLYGDSSKILYGIEYIIPINH
jgi:hypothetical protein